MRQITFYIDIYYRVWQPHCKYSSLCQNPLHSVYINTLHSDIFHISTKIEPTSIATSHFITKYVPKNKYSNKNGPLYHTVKLLEVNIWGNIPLYMTNMKSLATSMRPEVLYMDDSNNDADATENAA